MSLEKITNEVKPELLNVRHFRHLLQMELNFASGNFPSISFASDCSMRDEVTVAMANLRESPQSESV